MPEENVTPAPRKTYFKTGLLVGAIVLPMFGWAAKNVAQGAQNAYNGKDNFVYDDED